MNRHLNFSCPPGNVCFKQDNFVLSVVLFLLAGIIYAYVQSNQQQQAPPSPSPPPPPPPSYTPAQVVEQQPQRDLSHRRLGDPVEEPRRTYPFTTTVYNNVQRYQQQKQPINISTRGETRDFQPIGTLTNTNTTNNNNNNGGTPPHILQLFGRAIYPGSYKWQYYTNSDNFQSVKVQLVHKGRQCLDDIGCEELSTGDVVRVPAYQNLLFRVELYGLDKPTYIPYLV